MAEGGEPPNKRIIIPKGTLEADQNNIIEIPESCEDSRVLIARLQQRFARPPRYYPPLTNPENKFERRIGETVVGLGLPPLSPLKEERHNYKYSLSQYGPQQPKTPPPYVSYEPSYFGTDTTHGSRTISGKFDYCPASTPIKTNVVTNFPSPKLSPIVMGRDIFAQEPSVYHTAYTPPRRIPSPPRRPSPGPLSPGSDSCSIDDISGMLSHSGSPQAASPRRSPSPRRAAPPQRAPAPAPARRPPSPRKQRSPISDRSCSIGDLSDMMSFDASRGSRPSIDYTPDSIRGMSQIHRNVMAVPGTPIPEVLHNTHMNHTMHELDNIEVDELRTVQDRMRSFQEARRELMLSILALPEAEVISIN